MTNQPKKPQEDQPQPDTLKKVTEGEARAGESREKISEVLEKHRGEIRQIINLLGNPLLISNRAEETIQIKQSLPAEIDLRPFPGFMEAVRVGFLHLLRRGQADGAIRIRKAFGQGVDFARFGGYGEAVRSGFLKCLREGQIDAALKIRDELGQGIDFTDEIRAEFLGCLNYGDADLALKIRDKLGQGIDFGGDIRSAFLGRLKKGDADSAVAIRKKLGQGIDFGKLEGYGEAVKTVILEWLGEGFVDGAIRIHDEFGKGIDFRQSNEYKPSFSALCKKNYPDFGDYLSLKEADESLMKKYKNEFWVKAQNITQKLLLKFESLVVFADGFMRKAMKEKVRSYGVDPERPDWGERLTEGQKGEVGAFMDNLQTQIRAKLQTIASTEVINAYKDRDGGGMEWMEAAA